MKTLQVLCLTRCQERDTSFFAELDRLPQLAELRIGELRLVEPGAEQPHISLNRSPFDADISTKLRNLKTNAVIRLVPNMNGFYTLQQIESMQQHLKTDSRFRLGFINLYATPGLGHTVIAGGILMLFLNLQLFGQLSAPQAWLSTRMAWGQVLAAAGLWTLHTLAMVAYGQWWGTDSWAIVATQLLMPTVWGALQLATYQTERLGSTFCATLWGIMCGASGILIQVPLFFFAWVPYLQDFAAGELPQLTSWLLVLSAIFGGVVIWQLPKLPRLVEGAGIGDFPLGISFTQLTRYQQQRQALATGPFWQPQLKNMSSRLSSLRPGAFWSSPRLREGKWSTPIPFTWQLGLIGCLVAPIVCCAAIVFVQGAIAGTFEIPSHILWPMFLIVLLQTPLVIFLISCTQWLERTRMISWEVLRPISRRDLDRTYARSVALEIVPIAAWHLVSFLLAWVIDRAIRQDGRQFFADTVLGVAAAGLFGWLIAWSCLLAMIASGGWWRRVFLGLLGAVTVIGLVFSVALHLENRSLFVAAQISDGYAMLSWVGIICLGCLVTFFFRSLAARQWQRREFVEG